jgi:3-hydroxybutyryl-CoA dehydrogenase
MKELNILGFGIMGRQITGLAILLGYKVNLWNHRIIDHEIINTFVTKNEEYFGNKHGKLVFFERLEDLPDVFTIEALIEDIEIKKNIYNLLKHKLTYGYYTNTSSYAPSEIADGIGVLHFFNPMRMKLVEYMPTKRPMQASEKDFIDDLRNIGFTIVDVKNNRCFIGNNILFHEFSTFFKLIEKYGYNFIELQNVARKLYGERDILKIIDIIGVDVTLKIMENIKEFDQEYYVSKMLLKAKQNNILGYKNNTSIKDFLNT